MPENPVVYPFIGRLWGSICNARFINCYGESFCRLDRITNVFEHEEEQPSIVQRLISAVMFGYPEVVRQQLDQQLTDGLVWERVWSVFISDQMTEWQKLMQWTFALIM